jgi:hypothetical protein
MLFWILILVCVQDPTREVIVRHEAAEALGAIATDEVISWLAHLTFKDRERLIDHVIDFKCFDKNL